MKPQMSREGWFDEIFPLADGLIATDGVQLSAVATVGTTAVNILQKRIDPGFTVALNKLQVGLTQRFTNLNASFAGSISYYWTVKPVYTEMSGSGKRLVSGTTIGITPTYAVGVATLVSGSYSEDTLSGYIPVGSIPYAPFEFTLIALGIQAAIVTGQVKNSSFVRLVGNIVPGT